MKNLASRSSCLLFVLSLWAGSTLQSHAQTPASIAGRAVVCTITSGTGSTGSFRFLASASDDTYGTIGLTGNVEDSYGTFSYTKTGDNTGTVKYNDIGEGVSGFVTALTATSATTGTFYISNPSYPGRYESGTYELNNGKAPASIAGWKFKISVDAGIDPFDSSGTFAFTPAASGSGYELTGSEGTDKGTYTYKSGSASTSSISLKSTVFSDTRSQTLSWDSATSGAYVVRDLASGGFQAGTFTGTPPPELKTQTITFAGIDSQKVGAKIVLEAKASSGLVVSYTVTGPATLSGTTLKVTGPGTVTVKASQAGNTSFKAAESVTRSFTVAKATQTITFAAIHSQVFGEPLILKATASSGLVVTYKVTGPAKLDGSKLTFTGTGAVTVTASQAGSDAYLAAESVKESFAVERASQTITFAAIAPQTVGTITLTAKASSGLEIKYTVTGPATLDGKKLKLTGAGTVSVTASQAGNDNFKAAKSIKHSFKVTAKI